MATASRTTTKDARQTTPPQQAPNGNLPATQAQPEKKVPPIVAFKAYLEERMGELQFALPSHISPERFQRTVITALQRKPQLLVCTRQSLWNACLLAAHDGLLPDGREGAIVPYGENADGKKQADIATWMPMIEGLRKKARNSGEISDWLAFTVNARDQFDVILGDAPRISHKPYMGADDPGDIVAAYSIAWLKDGTISRDVMTIRDILKIKAKSKAKNGPWSDPTFVPEMCKKTVARRHYKQLPHSSDLDDMMKRDDDAFGLDDRSEDQIENRQARRLGSTSAAFDQFAGNSAPLIEHQQEDNFPADSTDDTNAAFADDDQGDDQQHGDADKQGGQQSRAGATMGNVQKAAEDAGGRDGPADEGQQPEGAKPGQESAEPDVGNDQSENDERRWPNGAVPKDADEYEHYAETKIGDFKNGPDVPAWWKSKEESDLRKACGVSKTLFDTLQQKASDRYSALLREAKGAK